MAQTETSVDTLIIGAGVIGSSLAMHLAQKGLKGIRVVDPDLEGVWSSSELNAGGVRATWNQAINIQASKLSIEYFASVAEEVGYRACGYLWLHPEERLPTALKARERQLAHGWPVEAWDVRELQRRVPFLDKTDGIAGALFAPRDGLLNPNRLKNHFREKARALGAVFDDRVCVRGAEYSSESMTPVKILADRARSLPDPETKLRFLNGEGGVEVERVAYRAKRVVNCAGPWAQALARVLGYPCPSHPIRRQVCIFDCRDLDLTPYGMIVDTSGVYFHPEATNGLAGFANPQESEGVNFQHDGESFFMERIWPALFERSSKFERLRYLTGWAGLYEVSPDECAILGQVELGEAGRTGSIYEAHSFSGHGVMQSYTAGLALAEKIVLGNYETIDFNPLAGKRFEEGRQVREDLII